MLRKKGFGPVADLVLTVHKRYDCTGYPEDVVIDMEDPKNGVLAVCDVCDVVSRGRPYQPGEGIEYALEEIQRSSGTQLHPQVVGVAVSSGCLEEKFFEISDEACLRHMKDVA
jgi:HD-GYP domain-containing protein (c-di-GMP phosphodiesterase class II)